MSNDPRQRLLPFVQAEPMTEPGPLDQFPPPPPRRDRNSPEAREEAALNFSESLWRSAEARQAGPGAVFVGGRYIRVRRCTP